MFNFIDNHLILSIFLYLIIQFLSFIPIACLGFDYFNRSFFKTIFIFIVDLLFIVFYTFLLRIGLYILGKFISILWVNTLILLTIFILNIVFIMFSDNFR